LDLTVFGATTGQTQGNIGPFYTFIYDEETNEITAKSYPNLTPSSSISLSNQGFRIFIDTEEIDIY